MYTSSIQKKDKPLVSIIVPIYNVEKYLSECIDSIVNQTYKNIEVILINDGSTDQSFEIANHFSKQYKNIVLINQTNKGLSAARNVGLEIAKGEWIVFVDSDDLISLDFVSVMLNANIENNTKLCAAQMTRDLKLLDSCNQNIVHVMEGDNYIELVDKFYKSKYTPIGAWGKMYHKTLFNSVRYPIGIIYEDGVTFFEIMSKVNKISLIDINLYYYRIVSNSILHAEISQKNFDILKKNQLIESWVKKNYPDDINYVYNFNKNYNDRTAIEALRETIKGKKIARSFLISLKEDNKKYSLLLKQSSFVYNNMFIYSIYLCAYSTRLFYRKFIRSLHRSI